MFCWHIVNRSPVRLYWRVRVLNVCSGHVLSLALTWSRGSVTHVTRDRASLVIIKCVVRVVMLFWLVFLFLFSYLQSKGHVFEWLRLVQIRRYIFLLVDILFVYIWILF